jgi:hypothetical protein
MAAAPAAAIDSERDSLEVRDIITLGPDFTPFVSRAEFAVRIIDRLLE